MRFAGTRTAKRGSRRRPAIEATRGYAPPFVPGKRVATPARGGALPGAVWTLEDTMTESPESELAEGLRRGDERAYEQLYARYADGLFHLAERMLGSAADAS